MNLEKELNVIMESIGKVLGKIKRGKEQMTEPKENRRIVKTLPRRGGKTKFALETAVYQVVVNRRDVLFVTFSHRHSGIIAQKLNEIMSKQGYLCRYNMKEKEMEIYDGNVVLGKIVIMSEDYYFGPSFDPIHHRDHYKIYDEYGINLKDFDLITMTGRI